MQEMVGKTLPSDYTIGWTGSAYQETGDGAAPGGMGFVFGLVMVFLILAAQYERWSLPLAVLTWRCRSRCSARWSPSGCAASTTTSTSRSAS